MPEKTYYFLSGMPRSGSTLLSSILNQNPRIYCGPSTPVLHLMSNAKNLLETDDTYLAFPKEEQKSLIIRSFIRNYYSDIKKPIIIDKNRGWTGAVPMAKEFITDNVKIICTVRDISEILTSFLMLIRKHGVINNGKLNVIDKDVAFKGLDLTDENRCEFLLSPAGICGKSSASIFSGLEKFKENILLVDYNRLVRDPDSTMKDIYKFLGEKYYKHDFNKITNINREKDKEIYGLDNLHHIRSKLEKTSPDPKDILPKSILEKCKDMASVEV